MREALFRGGRILRHKLSFALFILLLLASACAAAQGDPAAPRAQTKAFFQKYPKLRGFRQEGRASYYADKFQGRKTASGARYNKRALTCAHRSLPFGTLLKVEHVESGRSVVVEVNDRGPFSKGRIVDLSRAAAEQIGMIQAGVVRVKITVIGGSP